MNDDPDITLRLPLSTVATIVNLLSTGRFCDVNAIIAEIQRQGFAQLSVLQAPGSAVTEATEQSSPDQILN